MTEKADTTGRLCRLISRWFSRLLLSLTAILFSFVLAEMGLRLLGWPKFYKHYEQNTYRFFTTNLRTEHGPLYVNQPGRITFFYDGNPRGYFGRDNEVHHDVNPSGFRGPAFTPKLDGTFRMVFLGDSFTFGEGVHNGDTYPKVAARLLRKGGHRVEACNLGVGGYNTSQEADVLHLLGFALQPDVVVLGYTMNDAEPPLFEVDAKSNQAVRRKREIFVEAEGPLRGPPESPLFRIRLAQAIWKEYRLRYLTKQTVHFYRSIHAPDSVGRVESERALREIISQCHERGIPCVVVMFPLLYELSDDYPFADVHKTIGDLVVEAGGTFIDLLPALKGQNARKLIVHPTDQHPNEKVHEIAGRFVAQQVAQIHNSPLQTKPAY
ncbi:MAG: SGNH/GDSL hydrolase family protein [Lentisphaeria bacterium]|nr:SGNH/GDSL hydrolase family protein [Lentisphaeria bacterium]